MKYVLWALVLLLAAAVILTATARLLFANKVRAEVRELYQEAEAGKAEVVTGEDLEGLPACVRKWMEGSGVIGRERVRTTRLKQQGMMQPDPGKPWMPFTAEQYFNFEPPGFVWFAHIKAAPLVHIAGRDRYYEGRGHMLIKVMSLFKVADAVGVEIDQGSLVRFFSEILWSPSAALYDYIQWEAIDDRSARATVNLRGVTASGVFTFDQQGNPVSFSARRYREQGGSYTLEDWYVRVGEYREFDGVRLPARAEVIWKLPEGDLKWLQLEITEVEYDRPPAY
ncbi:MAG: hypothetical protein QHH02_07855 [Syntrophomonadaceae bacterium]|nr:hypothetical protein [Syntrophomonadaceae bacterium]